MNAINYFKLDIKLMRGTLKYYIFIPLVFIIFSLMDSSAMGIGYLFFFLVLAATVPFSVAGYEKCDGMYRMFPSKISSMVFGRFLYLISAMALVWLVNISQMVYFYKIMTINTMEIGLVCFSGMIATIVCFCQYPIYYKFGIQKGKVLTTLIYMIPAFLVFALPSLLKNCKFLTPEFLSKALTLTESNKFFTSFLIIGIMIIVGIVSYSISCTICENKEI